MKQQKQHTLLNTRNVPAQCSKSRRFDRVNVFMRDDLRIPLSIITNLVHFLFFSGPDHPLLQTLVLSCIFTHLCGP